MKPLFVIASQSNAVGDGVPDIPISTVNRVYTVSGLTLFRRTVVVYYFCFNKTISRHRSSCIVTEAPAVRDEARRGWRSGQSS